MGPDCRQTGLEADNRNRNENRSHITHESMVRIGIVEDGLQPLVNVEKITDEFYGGNFTLILGLQYNKKRIGISLAQDKYVANILKKFDFATVKTASTPMEPHKALIKDEEADSVDVHLYRLMIGSLMYLTASRPDIMFAVYACARFQVTPKMSHLHAMKRIFRYLKAKQTIVANSTTEAEYVATAANCCGQFVDQHNMVACLEKTKENAEFHQIVDFLSTCSINYALTVSPTIYASYIEQFWNTATSKTVNSVKQIHAIVDGKAVVISKSSVRSDLLFNDEDGSGFPNP
ncbi:hypothetical protein Tco_1564238 [Tanacetum coccineum]